MSVPRPQWFEWINLSAIFLGPVLALSVQRWLDWLREKKHARVAVYRALLANRATWLSPESIRAANSLFFTFDRRRDKGVRDQWSKILAHVNSKHAGQQWEDDLRDLRIDLYQQVAERVGLKHSVEFLKKEYYYPHLYSDTELEQTKIRKGLAEALRTGELGVTLREEKVPIQQPPEQPLTKTTSPEES